MAKKFKNILVLYKKSAYRIYFTDRSSFMKNTRCSALLKKEIEHLKAAHMEHYETLKVVTRLLKQNNIRFDERQRGKDVDYNKYDLIITVGGDGTFLEAATMAKKQIVIGINSAPTYSVGRLCIANKDTFSGLLEKIISGQFTIVDLDRIKIEFKKQKQVVYALNDVLFAHSNPAMLSRYIIKTQNVTEEHRSSGIWIASPVGSTGAVRSAGGKVLDLSKKQLQYRPRELYRITGKVYKSKGSVLERKEKISLVSLMLDGCAYVDGGHNRYSFSYGEEVDVTLGSNPIKTIKI